MNEPYLLSAIPESKDDMTYHRKLLTAVNDWVLNDNQDKVARAINWEMALRFMAGDQWLQYNLATNRLDSIPYTGNQRNIDRPVTNHYLRWIITNVSTFSSAPHITIDANSESPQDKMAARCGKTILDSMWEYGDKSKKYYIIAVLIANLGLAYRKSYKRDRLAYVGDTYLQEVCSEVVLPHRITINAEARSWEDMTDIMDSTPRRIDWIKQVFGRTGDGYTGLVKNITEENINDPVQNMYETTRHIIEGGYRNFITSNTGNSKIKNSAMVREIYSKPCKKYPQGRYVVIACNQVLYDSMLSLDNRSPYFYLEGEVWNPITRAAFIEFPASPYPLSLGAQLVPLQQKINKIDALVAYNRKTMAVGQWLIPNGSGIKDGEITGVPGQDIRYSVTGMGNTIAAPQKLHGVPLPAQVLEERQMAISEGDQLAFAAGLKSGTNPSGVNTLGQMQILVEEANSARSKQIEGWEKFLEKSEQLDLLNFQSCYQVADIQTARKFAGISRDISQAEWEKFIGADLKDNANVRIEPGSTIRESKIIRQNTILNLAKAGMLPEIMQDPMARKDFLEEFGLAKLFTENNKDVKMAEYAIEQMLDGKYPPMLDIYNPDIQLIVLVKYMKDPKYLELRPEIKMMFDRRKDEYMTKIAESLQRAPLITGEEGGAPSPQAGGTQSMPQPAGYNKSDNMFDQQIA